MYKKCETYYGEPGDDPEAPYYYEHQFASKIEEAFINEMGVCSYEYNQALNDTANSN